MDLKTSFYSNIFQETGLLTQLLSIKAFKKQKRVFKKVHVPGKKRKTKIIVNKFSDNFFFFC